MTVLGIGRVLLTINATSVVNPMSTLPESLLFTLGEFLERLVALITPHKFYTTRCCGVLASRQRISCTSGWVGIWAG
jgi:hypothetical protein